MNFRWIYEKATQRASPMFRNVEKYDPILEKSPDDNDGSNLSYTSQPENKHANILLWLCFLLALITTTIVSFSSARINSMSFVVWKTIHEELATHQQTANHPSSLEQIQSKPESVATTGDEFGHCGSSIEEARALGCKFDPMTWAWMRPECYREDLINSFLNRTEWRFYLNEDLNPKEEIPREEWLRGDHLALWTPRKYKFFHCTYLVRITRLPFRFLVPCLKGKGSKREC